MKLKFLFRAICPRYTYIKDVRDFPLIILNYDHASTGPFKIDEIMFSGKPFNNLEYVNKIGKNSWADYKLKKL